MPTNGPCELLTNHFRHDVILATARAILSTAARLFMQRGYHALSINDIARETGITKPTLYYHFPDKEELFVQLALRRMAEVHAEMDAAVAVSRAAPRGSRPWPRWCSTWPTATCACCATRCASTAARRSRSGSTRPSGSTCSRRSARSSSADWTRASWP